MKPSLMMKTPKETVLHYYPGAFASDLSTTGGGTLAGVFIPAEHVPCGMLFLGSGIRVQDAWKDAADSSTIKARREEARRRK